VVATPLAGIRGRVTLDAGLRRELRAALSELIPDVQVARLVASDAELPLRTISFQGSPETVWLCIIDEAERQARLHELLELVCERCPGDTTLTELLRQVLALAASPGSAPVAGAGGPNALGRPAGAPSTSAPVKVFYSYARADEALREELETHLALLKRQGLIEPWKQIEAGQESDGELKRKLAEAELVLLLVSPKFMASDGIWDTQLTPALERRKRGEVVVVPIIVKPTELQGTELMKLQALPRDGKPVASWPSQDEAWVDVAKGLRQVVEGIQARRRP
jgi:Effector-associated domain 1/TIR domain